MPHRFEPVLSVDDSWMVFDIVAGRPAERDGRVLIGLPAAECGELARHMNRAEREAVRSRGPDEEAGNREEHEPWKS
jgi:hypothetical protein